MTTTLYLRLISFFCILTFCKIAPVRATEISPIFGIGQENFTFDLTEFDTQNKNKKVSFEPNIAGILRLGLNAFGFGVGYSFRGTSKDTDSNKGFTDFSDWQLGYNSKNWGVEGFYQTYQGFYTPDTVQIQTFPNLSFRHVGLTLRYALGDEEFAVGTLMDQSTEFINTSGKYYLITGYDEHDMNTDTSLLQQEHSGLNSAIENLRLLKSTDVKLGLGAGKYWVISNNFFAGGMIDLLSTYANYKFTSTTGNDQVSDLTTSYNLRIGFGYKESKIRIGASLAGDATVLKTPGSGYLKPSANKFLAYLRYVTDF